MGAVGSLLIHPVFHASLLKPRVPVVNCVPDLPECSSEGEIIIVPAQFSYIDVVIQRKKLLRSCSPLFNCNFLIFLSTWRARLNLHREDGWFAKDWVQHLQAVGVLGCVCAV
ncbi:hypothetical protein ACLOJK_023006 [Asimina triloba]